MNRELNNITHSLYNTYRKEIDSIIKYDPPMRSIADNLFEQLVSSIHNKYDAIYQRVHGEAKKPLEIKSFNKFLKISFFVYPSGKSRLIISYKLVFEKEIKESVLKSKLKPISGYVYIIQSDYGYKIGKTTDIKQRLNDFGVKLPFKHWLHSYVYTENYSELEKELHDYFSDIRLNGEWFDLKDADFEEIDIFLKNKNLVMTINKKEGKNG